MKRLLITLFVLIILSNKAAYADWLDDYAGITSSTSPTAFASQQRSYYTGGGFTARVPHKSESLITIQKPSFKAGCGGIDTFFGGVSFLNPEYLVKKAESLLQNAPYIIFSIGLKALSTQFADTIEAANAITDQLNQLQFDECSASKGLVGMVMGDGAPELTAEYERMQTNALKLGNGLAKNFTTSASKVNSDPSGQKKDALSKVGGSMDEKVKELLTKSGFILDKLVGWADKSSSSPFTDNEARAIRSLVGDIYFDNDDPKNQDGLVTITVGCAANLSLSDYINSATPTQIATKPSINATCITAKDSVFQRSEANINKLYTAYIDPTKRKQAITVDVANFVSMSSLPVLTYLKDMSVLGQDATQATLHSLTYATASEVAYGSLTALSNNIAKIISALNESMGQNNNYAKMMVIKLSEYQRQILAKQETFRSEYGVIQNQFNTMNQIVRYLKETGKDAKTFRNIVLNAAKKDAKQ